MLMLEIEAARAVRRQLRRAWGPFLSRFGRLTPVQIEVIPRVMARANIVVISPTASGKTEAIVAPVAEQLMEGNWEGLAVVYVVPTRALANDTLARIEGPLRDMGLRCETKHGDSPTLSRSLPNFVITTPESLDSIICRRKGAFTGLRIIILDEIHLVDGGYRGDQLRILLARLRRLTHTSNLAIHILSATVAEPEIMARRYVGQFETIKVAGQREIQHEIFASVVALHRQIRTQRLKKILVFCNKRASVEKLAIELEELWRPYPVVAHHGSLSRAERHQAENLMKTADVAVCVATSTLEVGIDIGDIDVIVLAELPWSVSALLQRIGRGNRRLGYIRAWAIAGSNEERQLFDEMFALARDGTLPSRPYKPDLSVVVQQIFSCLFQYLEGLPEAELISLLSLLGTEAQIRQVLNHLRVSGWTEFYRGRWRASTRMMDLAEEGLIHSNIPSTTSYSVVDVDSGVEIGSVAGVINAEFILSRRAWQVLSVEDGIIRARQQAGAATAAMFGGGIVGGAFESYLPTGLHRTYLRTAKTSRLRF